MLSGKCERNVFKSIGMASNLFEETVLGLKSNGPFMDKMPKESNQSRIMLQIMMSGEQKAVWKKVLVSLAMFTDFTFKICDRLIRVDIGDSKLHYVFEIQNNVPYRFILWNKWTNDQRQQSKQRPIFMCISTNAFF